MRMVRRILQTLFVSHWQAIDREARAERESHPRDSFDWWPLIVLVTAAVAVTVHVAVTFTID